MSASVPWLLDRWRFANAIRHSPRWRGLWSIGLSSNPRSNWLWFRSTWPPSYPCLHPFSMACTPGKFPIGSPLRKPSNSTRKCMRNSLQPSLTTAISRQEPLSLLKLFYRSTIDGKASLKTSSRRGIHFATLVFRSRSSFFARYVNDGGDILRLSGCGGQFAWRMQFYVGISYWARYVSFYATIVQLRRDTTKWEVSSLSKCIIWAI